MYYMNILAGSQKNTFLFGLEDTILVSLHRFVRTRTVVALSHTLLLDLKHEGLVVEIALLSHLEDDV